MGANWSGIGYALLCIVIPMAWGLVIYRASNAIERRVLGRHRHGSENRPDEETLPLDYHI